MADTNSNGVLLNQVSSMRCSSSPSPPLSEVCIYIAIRTKYVWKEVLHDKKL